MTDARQREDALSAARDLTGALEKVWTELKRLNAYTRRTRHIVWVVIGSLVVDLAVTGLVIFGQVQISHNAASISALHATQVSACGVGNKLRDEQRALWAHVVAISHPPPHLPPAEAKARAKTLASFLAYVRKVLPDLDCQALYRQK